LKLTKSKYYLYTTLKVDCSSITSTIVATNEPHQATYLSCATQGHHHQVKLKKNFNKLNYKQTSTTTPNSLRKYGKVATQALQV
jgi:hypothetical protein